MTHISDCDHALTLVHGLELTAGADGNEPLVDACVLVLNGLLDIRLHLPLQRTSPDKGGTPCTDSPSTESAPPPFSSA